MAQMSGGDLAGAVSKAGGLGTFGAVLSKPAPIPISYIKEHLAKIRAVTDRPFGVGFITQYIEGSPENFDFVLSEEVPVILLSFADPRPWLGRIKAKGCKVICQVQTMDAAHIAVAEGADAIAVQGNEAGGDGAWIGTGFRAVKECAEISEEERTAILESDGRNTVRSSIYDTIDQLVEGTPRWPEPIAMRTKRTAFCEAGSGENPSLLHKLQKHRRISKAYGMIPSQTDFPIYLARQRGLFPKSRRQKHSWCGL
jgi:nitronate monooxygenase